MAVTISGMFGSGRTYFAGSPVVIKVENLEWPANPVSPFTVVGVDVIYDGKTVGTFREDAGNKSEISFNISSALMAIWSDYKFTDEVAAANAAVGGSNGSFTRGMREYSLRVYTEYLAADGEFTVTESGTFDGGRCVMGSFTEMERCWVSNPDVSVLEHSGKRFGDASTKPMSSPEIVGAGSITSWVDVSASGTTSKFWNSGQNTAPDDPRNLDTDWKGHAPIVVRNDIPYIDFIFLNRRGAIETCSAQMLEAMDISVETKQYARVEKPAFVPERSLTAIGSDGRRSWSMSSGHVTREWAEWWTMEFLGGKKKLWWMLYEYRDGSQTRKKFVPVTVSPAKKNTGIYDLTKQQMPSVEFTVTLALEG